MTSAAVLGGHESNRILVISGYHGSLPRMLVSRVVVMLATAFCVFLSVNIDESFLRDRLPPILEDIRILLPRGSRMRDGRFESLVETSIQGTARIGRGIRCLCFVLGKFGGIHDGANKRNKKVQISRSKLAKKVWQSLVSCAQKVATVGYPSVHSREMRDSSSRPILRNQHVLTVPGTAPYKHTGRTARLPLAIYQSVERENYVYLRWATHDLYSSVEAPKCNDFHIYGIIFSDSSRTVRERCEGLLDCPHLLRLQRIPWRVGTWKWIP